MDKTKNGDLLLNCVESRLKLLYKGYYDKVSDKLNEYIFSGQNGNNFNIIDSGCGPGFYLDKLKKYLNMQKKILKI